MVLLRAAVFVWVVLGGGVLAHHPIDATALVGLDVCVDTGSFAVRLDDGMPQGVVDARDAQLEMRATWSSTLSAAGVPWHDAASCVGASAYLRVGATVRFLDPATYVGFPEDSVSYVYHAGVAPHPSLGAGETGTAFAAGASEVIGGSDEPGRVAARLHDADRRSAMGLVQAWWTVDQGTAGGATAASSQWMIPIGVMIPIVLVWSIAVRTRRGPRPRRSLTKPVERGDDSAPPQVQEVLHVVRTQ